MMGKDRDRHSAQAMFSTDPIENDRYVIRPSFIQLPANEVFERAFRDKETGRIAAKIITYQQGQGGDNWLPLTCRALREVTDHNFNEIDCPYERCSAERELGNLVSEGWLVRRAAVFYYTPAFIELCWRTS